MWRGEERPLDRLLRLIRTPVEVLAYLFWLVVDVVFGAYDPPLTAGQPIVGALVAGLVLLRGRIGRARTAVITYAVSVGFTIVSVPFGAPSLVFAEQLALAVVTISAVRLAGRREALWLSLGAGVAIVASPLVRPEIGQTGTAFVALSVMGWIGTVAIGLALRETRSRRLAELADARSAERMELARELHDVIAHHVTGIVVAAQAAGVVARTRPEEVGRALESIEHAGTDALGAMRSMVGVLRGQQDPDAARTPGPDLGEVDELVRRFDDGRGAVTLRSDPGLTHAVLPAGVAASGYRIVQEALTNVRRHAPRAASVEVDLRMTGDALLVVVRNDGVEQRKEPVIVRGGFGLAGMAERVAALGGELRAGPDGPHLWTVSARLPVREGTS
ncbi:sensor histidine kinase [Pseudonocardia endophytica]|uniref:histidine kinase n=1 Tax=Pseudonocardia endophytica TaxID=401976 RepID=A0A4V6NDD3_PSEEN|nr:histidine kinase [Pseudonocardia endophytica]TCK20086.1 signal transduction histidine kinase [Pseudonocardia endophytica]